MSKLEKTAGYEANPYSAQLPPEVEALGQPVASFLQEVMSTLREQHNATQSGDSTVPWEHLTAVDDSKAFSLGALGRFLHPDYGILTARYVEFVGEGITTDEFDFGLVAGYTLSAADHQWAVTTNFSESDRLNAVGLIGGYTRPRIGQFGWVIVSGVNLQSIRVYGEIAPAIGDTLVWHDNKSVEVSKTGTSIGVVNSLTGLRKSGIIEWELAPASIRVDVFRQPATFASPLEITDEQIQDIANRVGLLLDIEGLRQLVLSLQQTVSGINIRLGDEISQRIAANTSLQSQIDIEHQTNIDQSTAITNLQTTVDAHTVELNSHQVLIDELLDRHVHVIEDNTKIRIASAVDHLKYIRFTNLFDVVYKFQRDNDLEINSVITIRDVSTRSLKITTDFPADVKINKPFFGTLESAGVGATIQIVKVGINEYDVFGHVRTS